MGNYNNQKLIALWNQKVEIRVKLTVDKCKMNQKFYLQLCN